MLESRTYKCSDLFGGQDLGSREQLLLLGSERHPLQQSNLPYTQYYLQELQNQLLRPRRIVSWWVKKVWISINEIIHTYATTVELGINSTGFPNPVSNVAIRFNSVCKSTRWAKYQGLP